MIEKRSAWQIRHDHRAAKRHARKSKRCKKIGCGPFYVFLGWVTINGRCVEREQGKSCSWCGKQAEVVRERALDNDLRDRGATGAV